MVRLRDSWPFSLSFSPNRRESPPTPSAGVRMSSPSRNQHLGFLQRGEDLAIEQFIPELCSVTPIDQNINPAQLGDNLLRRKPTRSTPTPRCRPSPRPPKP